MMTPPKTVVIQRVIREVGGGSSYHTLIKTNYSDCALLINVKLKVWALWSVIDDDGTDQQEDGKLYLTEEEMTKDAWDAIATMRVGDDRMKKATTQQLRQKFDLTTFDDDETVEDYVLRLSGMAAHLATLSEEVKDSEIVVKMFRSLPPRFKQITIVIKTLFDVSTMSVADLTGWLKEAEEAFEEAPPSLQ
jgi:hypothetical protein